MSQDQKGLASQLTALQHYTATLQEDFDYNLRLLDARDAELIQRDRDLEALQQQDVLAASQQNALQQQLASSHQSVPL